MLKKYKKNRAVEEEGVKKKKKWVEYFGREPVKARCARGEMFDTITKIL